MAAEGLSARTWRFGRPGEEPDAPHLRLLSNGALGGLWAARDLSWRWRDGELHFLDEADVCTTVFDRMEAGEDGAWVLLGRTVGDHDGRPERELRERMDTPGLARMDPGLRFLSRPGPDRRNLVVLRAGEGSLHHRWPQDIPPGDRSWDLCISWYGDAEGFGRDPWAEHQVLQNGMRKLAALHALFPEDGAFWRYDYVAFPEDDLMLSWRDWNLIFAVCRRHDLLLAQPAITGYANQPILRPQPDAHLRFTSWVEMQTPVFSREALRICAPTFGGSRFGFGWDHVWPKLLGEPAGRIGIIDAVTAEHTRPGNARTAGYDYEEASREGAEVTGRYRAPWRTLEFGAMRATPRRRPPAGYPEDDAV